MFSVLYKLFIRSFIHRPGSTLSFSFAGKFCSLFSCNLTSLTSSVFQKEIPYFMEAFDFRLCIVLTDVTLNRHCFWHATL